jgi:flagellar hook-associated protein 2
MATSSSSGLSSLGVGSNLDVDSIISSLMKVERAPLTGMQDTATKLNAKLSSYGKLQSYVSALGDAAGKLATSSNWAQTKATSSVDAALSATTTDGAVAGAYSIQVTALASSQTLASASRSSATEAAGMSGTLRIEGGNWNADQSAFTPINYPSFVDVAISSSDSMESIRDKINASSAGVSASIISDSSGSRLILRSKATGAESGFRLSVTDDDGDSGDANGLSSLGFDPSAGVNSMQQTKAASDAIAVVDGLTVTSKTNTFDGVIQGVSFVAKAPTTTAATLSVAYDTDTMRKNVEAFVTAYNDLATYMKAQTKYDQDSKTAGTLQGDAGANALRSALRSLGTANSGGSASFDRLSEIGLDPQSDGTLKIDTGKLTAAVAKPEEMKKLFGDNAIGDDTDDGFGSRIRDWSRSMLSIDGAVVTRQTSLKEQLRQNSKQQSDFEDRMTAVQARLTAQYSALDTQMGKLNALSTYVTQQVANWNKSSS